MNSPITFFSYMIYTSSHEKNTFFPKLLVGHKKGFSILCCCCDTEVSPSIFEAHAGHTARRKPYTHIFTSDGISLHEFAVSVSQGRKLSPEEHDDLCSICATGGDLFLCDSCPRAFHQECLSRPSLPQETWYCRYCQNRFQKEKIDNADAIAAGRTIRVVETCVPEEYSSCVLCRKEDFEKEEFGPRTVIICDQCDKEYHIGCLKEHNMDDLKELPNGPWFCCVGCSRIQSSLETLIGEGEMKLPEGVLDMIKKKRSGSGSGSGDNLDLDLDIKWRLFQGKLSDAAETMKWLSAAATIFHEQFDPITDRNSVDLIPLMVYGRKFNEQDLGGMYTAMLTVKSVVVCAGIFRIWGEQVGELPLVATRSDSQGLGYFQSLFHCIESTMRSLNVKDLVLPSAETAKSIWINKFGFQKISDEQMEAHLKDCAIMGFQGTTMLHKLLLH